MGQPADHLQPQGQIAQIISPGSGGTDQTTSYIYDASGNLLIQDDNGNVTSYPRRPDQR